MYIIHGHYCHLGKMAPLWSHFASTFFVRCIINPFNHPLKVLVHPLQQSMTSAPKCLILWDMQIVDLFQNGMAQTISQEEQTLDVNTQVIVIVISTDHLHMHDVYTLS